jgi:hypothetical protein
MAGLFVALAGTILEEVTEGRLFCFLLREGEEFKLYIRIVKSESPTITS